MSAKKKPTVAELTEALQRERADAMNVRRRYEEQIASLRSSVKSSVVRELLPLIDNLERAMKHYPLKGKEWDLGDELHEWLKGVRKISDQFEKVLEDLGVNKIKTVGEHFNANLHEAVSMEDGDGKNDVISEELQSGYVLGDEVIRHAMVKVKKQ